MKIEYSILTPSTMKIIVDGKVMHIEGEGTTEPKFYADSSSINKWDPPFENEAIPETLKKEIVTTIESDSKRRKVPVVFD